MMEDVAVQEDAEVSPEIGRYAVVAGDGGIVVNIIEAVEGFVVEGAALVADDGSARIGGVWDGVVFRPPEPAPEPVPNVISRRQLLIALAAAGFISAEEALAAAETRARPPQLDAIIATLPEDAALAARITWATMTEARRGDALFAALIAAGHATAEQVDEIFRAASQL
jgi:ribulose 1,5-bisphosphate synthetase/thiazole synthase